MPQTKLYIYPYKSGSRSARALADALGAKIIRRENSAFVPREHKKVINWGSSDCSYQSLNNKNFVKISSNKLDFFQYVMSSESPGIEAPRFPRWTTDKFMVADALRTEQYKKVVCRTILNGHSGQGIVITDDPDDIPDAPLYVEYIPKDAEYRLHVFDGEIIDVQRKVKDPDREVLDWKVRSHQNGFIYVRNDSQGRAYIDTIPVDIREQALKAMACSGLTFGGVDIIWNQKREKSFVLEINTAVGLQGETVNKYAQAIRKYYDV